MEPFTITLANDVEFTVQPAYLNGKDLSYQLFIDGVSIGAIMPFVEDIGLVWRTNDNIDPDLVDMISEMIDRHEKNNS